MQASVHDVSVSSDPGDRECLLCYLSRMVNLSGCDGTHRWTVRWRDARAPRRTGLLRELARRGGICCDCEVMLNVWPGCLETAEFAACAGTDAGRIDPCSARSARL